MTVADFSVYLERGKRGRLYSEVGNEKIRAKRTVTKLEL